MVALVGFSVLVTLFPMVFIYDLGFRAMDSTVQPPQGSEILGRITLLTFGAVIGMIIVISLLERIVGREDRI